MAFGHGERDFNAIALRVRAEMEQRRATHMKERLARGLAETTGTGKPKPAVMLLKVQSKGRAPNGASRIGGLPDLPRSIERPGEGRLLEHAGGRPLELTVTPPVAAFPARASFV